MIFDEALAACRPHPNGTYDLQPVVYLGPSRVEFRLGNSLLLVTDPRARRLAEIVGKVFEDVHPHRIQELLKLETCVVVKSA